MGPVRAQNRILSVVALLAGCTCDPPADPAPPASGSVLTASASAPTASVSVTHYTAKTTSASIELNNLTGQINSNEKQLVSRPHDIGVRSKLVGVLLLRSRVVGKSADLVRAIELAEQAVKDPPDDHRGHLLRARARAAAHRFTDALADLEVAEKHLPQGESNVPIRAVRSSVLVATGKYDEALKLTEERTRLEPSTQTFGDYAALLGKVGQHQQADAMFLEAELKFRSLSPIPLVELYFDRGSMWERAGNLELATQLYRAAHARLPPHVHVATHLAQLVPPSEAVTILEPLTAESDDPDLFAQLGMIKNLLQPGTGDASIAKAKELYDAHYTKLPEAYADHAGWFWTNLGGDPSKALGAAQKNLEQRKTAEAYELLIAAANAAEDVAAKCQAKQEVKSLKYVSIKLAEQLRQLEGKIECPAGGITPTPSATPAVSASAAKP